MDLVSLSQLGRIEEETEVIKGLKIKLHTLSSGDQEFVAKAITPSTNSETSIIAGLPTVQQIVLAKSTVSINGEAGTFEQFLEAYKVMQHEVIRTIYTAYLSLLDKQDKVVEELKKK